MSEIQNPYKLIDRKALAEVLNLSPFTIDLWRKREGLPVAKIGGRYLFRLESVNQWLQSRESTGAADDEPEETGVIRQVRL